MAVLMRWINQCPSRISFKKWQLLQDGVCSQSITAWLLNTPFRLHWEDSLNAYHWCCHRVYVSEIAIAGDLQRRIALSTLVALRDVSEPLPACAVVISPWVDLTLSGNSIHQNAQNDPILSPKILESFTNIYVADNITNNPLISPLFADLNGLPPLLIHVGSKEILW